MATHSSVLAWRIPGTVGPGGLLSMGSCLWGRTESDTTEATYHTLLEAPKSLQMVTAAMKLKDTYSLEEKL